MRGLILGQLFCLCRELDSFSRGIWYATFKNYLSSSLHLFHLPVEVYIYSIYQSKFTFIPFTSRSLHLFHLPVSFTFIPLTSQLYIYSISSLVNFIPFTSSVYFYSSYSIFLNFMFPFNTWLMLILENHCVFSPWIGPTIVYATL
jgi:hypothetical protein